jgi:hypothetical protein
MGGTDDPSNLIELTVFEHAEEHRKLYEHYGKIEDKVAWLALSGQAKDSEFIHSRAILGGKTQGKRNSESGHMKRIQKMSDLSIAGKKGGTVTMKRGKGSFANSVDRLKSASNGGKIQGKINAESGHCKKISEEYWKKVKSKEIIRTKKIWITNDVESKLIIKGDIIENGWKKGRIQKTKI